MESARCKAFLAAAESGSFSKAAERLNYTPSGVTQLVTALEKELGVILLHRTKKGVSLTASGELLLPAARSLVQQESNLYQLAAEINGLAIGSISIAAYPSMAAQWLPKVICGFQSDYPQIGIHIREGSRQEIVEWLRTGTADLGFLSNKGDLTCDWIPLAEDRMVAILAKTHPLAGAEAYPLERCREERFIMPAFGRDADVMAMFEENDISPDIFISTVEGISAMSMIESGLGMGIMNELITVGYQCDVVKLPVDPPQHITLGIALPALEAAPPAVKRFVKYAVRCLTQKADLDA